MRITSVVLIALVVAACRSATAPYADVSVTVDSAAYHLQPKTGYYTITLTATIANKSGRDIYLSRFCPATSLRRPDGYSSRLEFGQLACAASVSSPPPPTLTLSPGAIHRESFALVGSEQPQAKPKITMQDLTGPAVFGFVVSTDLRRFEGVMSPTFVLQPPG